MARRTSAALRGLTPRGDGWVATAASLRSRVDSSFFPWRSRMNKGFSARGSRAAPWQGAVAAVLVGGRTTDIWGAHLRHAGANWPPSAAAMRPSVAVGGGLWAARLLKTLECSTHAAERSPMSLLSIVLIVALVVAIGGAGFGHSRYGYVGWSPAGILLLIIGVLWLTGGLHR
jgi:hypothetical protein